MTGTKCKIAEQYCQKCVHKKELGLVIRQIIGLLLHRISNRKPIEYKSIVKVIGMMQLCLAGKGMCTLKKNKTNYQTIDNQRFLPFSFYS
jgi:hypothetical protein